MFIGVGWGFLFHPLKNWFESVTVWWFIDCPGHPVTLTFDTSAFHIVIYIFERQRSQ